MKILEHSIYVRKSSDFAICTKDGIILKIIHDHMLTNHVWIKVESLPAESN